MREIPLTQGKVALVDDGDYETLSKFKWHAAKSSLGRFYARRAETSGVNKQHLVYMHELLLTCEAGFEPDHKDRNGLNNQRNNLRSVPHFKNCANVPGRINQTGFKGVFKKKVGRNFGAQISGGYVNGKHKNIHLGYFQKPDDAARAYDVAAIQRYGDCAVTNASLGLI